jgi:hypothetical protein
MYKLLTKRPVREWLAVVGTATLVIGASYTMVQQSTRLAADDAPLALSQVIKSQLDSGASPNDVVTAHSVNLRSNTNTFAVITDAGQHVLASSASLDGQSPLPPKGVFNYTKARGSDSFTWQPAEDVRLATYVTTYGQAPNDGFIITGQSLSPAEDRIDTYGSLAMAAWLAVVAWNFLLLILPERRLKQVSSRS